MSWHDPMSEIVHLTMEAFQFLIGNVLASTWDLAYRCIGWAVSIPYRQCLGADKNLKEIGTLEDGFQFLIGNVLARYPRTSRPKLISLFQFLIGNVLARFMRCSHKNPICEFQFLIGNVLATKWMEETSNEFT